MQPHDIRALHFYRHPLVTAFPRRRNRSHQWEGPETPQAWLTAMVRKKVSLSRWEGAVARGDLLDHPVDLSNLFNPNTFLNAVRQQVPEIIPIHEHTQLRFAARSTRLLIGLVVTPVDDREPSLEQSATRDGMRNEPPDNTAFVSKSELKA